MKLIQSSFEILEQEPGIKGACEQIEIAGRTCYKSVRKNEDADFDDFAKRMIKSGHLSMLEHGTVYLDLREELNRNPESAARKITKYSINPYSKVVNGCYITTNMRVIVENGWHSDLILSCEPTKHHRRYTVRFITDRGISHELVRHRKFSFAQESSRYCNYSKDRFNNELTFIIPGNLSKLREGHYDRKCIIEGNKVRSVLEDTSIFLGNLSSAEEDYLNLIKLGWKPEEARQVLPNALKTEIIMTGFDTDWKYFFNLRSSIAKTGKPHPDMLKLINPLMKEFKEREYVS